MGTLLTLLRASLFGCQHSDMYRERRPLHGVDVLHFVCASCGHAVPAIQRTADEYQRVAAEGAVQQLRSRRQPAVSVVTIDRRRAPRLEPRHRVSA